MTTPNINFLDCSNFNRNCLKSKIKLEGKDQKVIFLISFSKSHCIFLSENLFAEKRKQIVSDVLPTSNLTATFNSQMKLEIKTLQLG